MEVLYAIRDICRSLAEFESTFEELNRISLNEAVVLFTISGGNLTASQIAKQVGMTASNASKVIKNVESKWLIERKVGKRDKREMHFVITHEGASLLKRMGLNNIELPAGLQELIRIREAQEKE